MRKRNLLVSGIVIMALGAAMGCGSKENLGEKSSSTYNKVNTVVTTTKRPTVIVTQTQQPVETPEVTQAPEKTKKPEVKKEEKKTEAPKKTSTPAPEKTAAPTKKPVKTTAPTKKPQVKKTATPAPKVTQEVVTKSVKNIKSMKSILTTVALYMAEGQTYDAKDEECYYSIMYMLANNTAYQCGKSQYRQEDGMIYVGEKAMQALSSAAFANHKIIGDVSKEYEDLLTYDAENKEYMVYGSDAGDVTGKMIETKNEGNGIYTVYFNLLSGDGKEVLSSYRFTLVENQSKYAAISPNFYYRVQSVKKLTE